MINGVLPLGKLDIGAVAVGEQRVVAYVSPEFVDSNDPKANLHAFKIDMLVPSDRVGTAGAAVVPGRYYVFLSRNGEEIVGADLPIE